MRHAADARRSLQAKEKEKEKMTLSNDEIKKGKKRIGCILVLLIPLILIGGYSVWIAKNFGKSLKKTSKKIIKRKVEKQKIKDNELIYAAILGNNQTSHFTGIEKKEQTIYTNALLIQSKDSLSIKYRLESLKNWKSKDNIEGVAKLDLTSVGNSRWKIIDKENQLISAFRFLDSEKDCQVEILISKEEYFPKSISVVKEICTEETTRLTMTMNYK